MKKLSWKLFTVCLMVLLSTVSVYASGLDRFTDVKSHWAASALERAVNDGVLNGSDNKLNPDGTLNASEMAAILVRKTDSQQWSGFYPGTSSGDWYHMTCAIAMHKGILPGDGSEAPKLPVTREQVFLAFANAYDYDTAWADPSVLYKFEDGYLVGDEYTSAAAALISAGIISGDDRGMINPQSKITRAEFVTMLYRAGETSAGGLRISMNAPDVKAGGSLSASVSFKGADVTRTCEAQWYLDGKPLDGYYAAAKEIGPDASSSFSQRLKFTKNMALSHRIGFGLNYTDPATGELVRLYTEKTVSVQNYSSSHYDQQDNQALYRKALATVTTTYKGNYTSSYNIDYSKDIKQAFVNAKGYSSRTKYLVWVNLSTQKVNVFTGSKGSWQLKKTFRCASGAKSTPTPVGVTYVTYKQTAWVTDSYTCRPIVRFYPNTGYAFHSRLYYPNTNKVKDGSMGFPVSHGCVRMEDEGIYWIYNNIPVNSTVVIY